MRSLPSGRALLFLSAAAVTGLLLAGCARNLPAPKPVSQPNEYSAYFYSAATCLYFDYQYRDAEQIYRLAKLYDPQAPAIGKGIFAAVFQRVEQDEVPLSYFAGLTDSLLAQGIMDKTMLEEAYNVFSRRGQNEQALRLLQIYLKSYSSARAYTSLFYLEQQMRKVSRVELLDKALKLAGEDSTFLNSLGSLYLEYDSTRAEEVWLTSLQYDTTPQAAVLLWTLYAEQNATPKLRQLYAFLERQEDKSKLDGVMGQTLLRGEAASLLPVADLILNSGEKLIILKLLQASWEAENLPLVEQSLNSLLNMQLTGMEEQLVAFYGALYYLVRDYPSVALSYIAKLNGKAALDELVYIYRATAFGTEKQDDEQDLSFLKKQFRTMLEPATPKQFPWEIKDYLLALTEQLSYDNQPVVDDDITKQCVLYFYDTPRCTYDTYIWLAQYYQKIKNDINLNAVLRDALQEYPRDAELLNWLGYNYVRKGFNLDEAEVLIRRALEIDPQNPYYLDSLAWLYFQKNDFAAALKFMEIPSALETMPAEIAYHIARIYIALDRYQEAVPFLKLAIAAEDNADYLKECTELLQKLTP